MRKDIINYIISKYGNQIINTNRYPNGLPPQHIHDPPLNEYFKISQKYNVTYSLALI